MFRNFVNAGATLQQRFNAQPSTIEHDKPGSKERFHSSLQTCWSCVLCAGDMSRSVKYMGTDLQYQRSIRPGRLQQTDRKSTTSELQSLRHLVCRLLLE